jgi:competence ComEA-like helix-hairpin-helix protein
LGPRVPTTREARLFCLALIAFGTLEAGRGPQGSEGVVVTDSPAGCFLSAAGAGRPCPCERIPARIRWALGLPLRLNHAPAEGLALLPGIGPVRARAIVEDRALRGGFESVEALARVPGIGAGIVARVRDSAVADEPDPACVEAR